MSGNVLSPGKTQYGSKGHKRWLMMVDIYIWRKSGEQDRASASLDIIAQQDHKCKIEAEAKGTSTYPYCWLSISSSCSLLWWTTSFQIRISNQSLSVDRHQQRALLIKTWPIQMVSEQSRVEGYWTSSLSTMINGIFPPLETMWQK